MPALLEPARWWQVAIPLTAVVVFSIVLRYSIVSMPLERDEGEYAYIAARWLAGDVPYRDVFNQKTPGVFAAYAALFAAGFRSVMAIHWLGHGALVSTVLVLYFLARRLFSHQVGWIAGLFLSLIGMSPAVLGSAANTEVFAILPLTAGVYFALRASETGSVWDGVLTGVFGGLALACKQVTLPVVLFSFVWVIYYRGRARVHDEANKESAVLLVPDSEVGIRCSVSVVEVRKAGEIESPTSQLVMIARDSSDAVVSIESENQMSIRSSQRSQLPLTASLSTDTPAQKPIVSMPTLAGALLFGLVLVGAPICIYFASQGAWSAFFDCVAGHNLAYGARIPLRFYGWNFWVASKYLYIVFAPMFAAAAYAMYVFRSRGATSARFCLWWLLASFLATSAGGYYRRHYLVLLLPPLAVIAAYGIEAVAALLEPKRRSSQRWVCAGLAIAVMSWPLYLHRNYFWSGSVEFICRQLYGMNPFPESQAVGKLLRDNSDPQDRIFILGSEPQILFFADRASASRYVFVYPLFVSAQSIDRQKEVMAELRRQPPKFMVLVDPGTVATSFSIGADSPQYIFDSVGQMLHDEYVPFAASTVGVDGTTRIARPKYEDGVPSLMIADGERVIMRVYQRRAPSNTSRIDQSGEDGVKSQQSQLETNLNDVRARIDRAARVSGRNADSVRLVAVTKTVDIPVINQLAELGITDLAESRPQELWRKHELIGHPVRWHLVGPLQKNKARRTLPLAEMIHSVDTESLLDRLNQLATEMDLCPSVLLEVNVSGETAKHGFSPSELPGIVAAASEYARLQIHGLMTMAPQHEDPENARPYFASLREMRNRLASLSSSQCPMTELSMGMSGDFEVAIQEGATMVRIGSALFQDIGNPT